MRRNSIITILLVLAFFSGCATKEPKIEKKTPGHYTKKTADPDGIGKVFLGREISQALDFSSVLWMERAGRESTELPQLAVDSLELKETDVVADVGAGSGYMSVRIARKIPKGKLYAVDISEKMLKLLYERAVKEKLHNIEPVIGNVDDPKLPHEAIDVVVMVDAYHEFSHPKEMMRGIFQSLKPGGRVVLIEYRQEDPKSIIKPLHKMSEKQIILEMRDAGLKWIETKNMLPQQHFVVFEKNI